MTAQSKARTLDPLEQTLKRFPHLRKHKEQQQHNSEQTNDNGLKICPNCGSKSLRLDGGCRSCLSCGWSACG